MFEAIATYLFHAILLTTTTLTPMGADHPSGDLPPHAGWPKGVHKIVNQSFRVHGYWVNSFDQLFYQSKQADLHTMLEQLAEIEDANVEVVLHAGKGVATSPWAKAPVSDADWSVSLFGSRAITREQHQVQVNIWLGGNINLEKLKIPQQFPIKSGGEIGDFIQKHQSQQGKK